MARKVYVVVDWSNSDILGVYLKKSSANKSLKDEDTGDIFDADIVEIKLEK